MDNGHYTAFTMLSTFIPFSTSTAYMVSGRYSPEDMMPMEAIKYPDPAELMPHNRITLDDISLSEPDWDNGFNTIKV